MEDELLFDLRQQQLLLPTSRGPQYQATMAVQTRYSHIKLFSCQASFTSSSFIASLYEIKLSSLDKEIFSINQIYQFRISK